MLVMWPGLFEQTFLPSAQGRSILKFVTIGPVAFELSEIEIL